MHTEIFETISSTEELSLLPIQQKTKNQKLNSRYKLIIDTGDCSTNYTESNFINDEK